MEWQLIETAPKDGTAVLGYGLWAGETSGQGIDPDMLVIQWNGGRTDYAGFDWIVLGTDEYAAWLKPTHWMPLPPPPTSPSE